LLIADSLFQLQRRWWGLFGAYKLRQLHSLRVTIDRRDSRQDGKAQGSDLVFGCADMGESQYNIWVNRSDAAYVFNVLSGALLRIPEHEYRTYRAFLMGDVNARCSPELLAN
jgi:hypothetical protein